MNMRTRDQMVKGLASCALRILYLGIFVFFLLGLGQARAGILVVDDFEDPASSEKLWDQSSDGILNIVTDPAKAHSGSRVNELVYTPGWNGPGFMNRFFSPVPEVYIRWYEKYSPGWIWSQVATKGIFLLTNSGNTNLGVVTGVRPAPSYIADVNSFDGLKTGFQGPYDQWICFEVRWHAHTGVFQMWINDVQRINANVGTIPTQFGINTFTVSGYYNDAQGRSCTGQVPCGVPQLQTRWIDDVAVSTARIGCTPETADKTPPSAPKGVQITTP